MEIRTPTPPLREIPMTDVQEFYSGTNIFITGGTGFLGKIMLQKILTACPGVETIFILVRQKKGKDVHSRVEEIFDDVMFDAMKQKVPKFRYKIHGIAGDCLLPGLGISPHDKEMLISKVNIVFHMAASVRFDEPLKIAVKINVSALKDLLNICNEMKNLKSMIHVSTAYSHSPNPVIEEKFYPPPMEPSKMLGLAECTTDKLLADITPILVDKWPNTYTFTKAIAEDVLRQCGTGLPIGMVRPGIVTSTYQEPIRGWVDNFYGPTGVITGVATGVIRTLRFDPKAETSLVPVDLCVNNILVAAWDVHKKFNTKITIEPEIPIYNFCTSKDNPMTWGNFTDTTTKYGLSYPTMKAIWYISFRSTPNKFKHILSIIMLHYLPSVIIDAFALVIGKKPRLLSTYKKIHHFMGVIDFFAMRQWDFHTNNTEALWKKLSRKDQELFDFDMSKLDWESYLECYFRGVRKYLLNDPLESLPEAIVRWNRLYWLHQSVKMFCTAILLRTIWSFISIFLNK